MALRVAQHTLISVGIIVMTAVAGIYVWSRLPAEMAVHFSATGRPGNYVPRSVGVFSLPVVMLLVLLVFQWAARVDPPRNRHAFAVFTVATVALLATVQLVVLAWNLGYEIPFDLILGGILLWMILIVSYLVLKEVGSSPI